MEQKYTLEGAWTGWDGNTIVEMTDGSKWKQEEYHYEYRYAYRPKAHFNTRDNKLMVEGMRRAVRVRRL
ncbi:hypothetical protein [Mycolicibacterium grossiae]|uniref:Uncharacterized protein n=1 Tax=Mycolicibacterium grossiae TaxID=1552759 RepID=A0A1E8PX53_9MYCO|nr:hypothetical protein [Mycolicibacterium grossiae]OFJ50898.1 hypothetical protein BEL07_25700 [Mycolicibacterium grossiae]QEM45682.1 hypothetical protein FZ046_13705 [Mycolicibacterium grossiae]